MNADGSEQRRTGAADKQMLPLNDARWLELDHRGWSCCSRPKLDANAPFVPDVLRQLYDQPYNRELFSDLWPYLCSEGTTWSAAYAALPHVVELASRVPPAERTDYLIFLGLALIDSTPESGASFAIKPYLMAGVVSATQKALPLVLETLPVLRDPETVRYLLATVAALTGFRGLGAAIKNLDLFENCPNCREELFRIEQQERSDDAPSTLAIIVLLGNCLAGFAGGDVVVTGARGRHHDRVDWSLAVAARCSGSDGVRQSWSRTTCPV